ncbi:hypothetical protein QAA18_09240 [Luteimonas sp. 8-5]|uniref:hypothetical protein n=1 Tax=Luteimonas sp. 8-5 TaxID=3039387 RepID=UPI00243713E2|nr:hypothetical protein [Luteimonas sp. 8-5]MDG6348918.1 hypothetical protein [Luteimonas sp. 8-5]
MLDKPGWRQDAAIAQEERIKRIVDMKVRAKRWLLIGTLLVSALVIGAALASRYQPNVIVRTFYSDPAKTQWAGHAMLTCPSSNGGGWELLDGVTTTHYTDQLGPECPTGPGYECPLCF